MKVDLLNVDYCIRVNVCVIHMYEVKKSVSDMNVQGEKFKRHFFLLKKIALRKYLVFYA